MATLLRADENGDFLIAEDSFYVQLKSKSVPHVTYTGDAVRWLEQLRLPFLIGRVDRSTSSIELYAGHAISRILIENQYHEIRLCFERTDESGGAANERTVNIGPPLMIWDCNRAAEKSFPAEAYAILKPYLEVEQRNLAMRSLRCVEWLNWQTNEPPIPDPDNISHMGSSLTDDDVLNAFKHLTPILPVLFTRALAHADKRAIEIAALLADYMHQFGVQPPFMKPVATLLAKWEEIQSQRHARNIERQNRRNQDGTPNDGGD